MTLLVIKTANRRGMLYEITGVIKDYASIEWVFVSIPSESERVIAMRLSDSLPINAINKLRSIDGIHDIWASHEAPMELVGFDKETLTSILMRITQSSGEVNAFLTKLGYEMGLSMASIMMRTKYEIPANSTMDKVLETAINMLVIMNLAKGIESINTNPDKNGNLVSVSLIEPFDLDTGLPFTRGYLLGVTKILLKCDCNLDVIINKTRVNIYIKGR
ncbi:hypothetical protein [Vulcanisaeta souniana]|uniref:Uncharacterized protein n=1 Tax=Vulcanisaeta souniana JCM 11219 TaxID=1293586 RepID=A0A830EHG7_9CREN|nr:hypothetical protein [Vulcanisaeta souniana]BDR93426.1 hypothetical protein Vsou_25190 [Vulcanisaeta souniana JCM 11219]GGI77026.1 hypothetical protein GCM10007112_12290 [Vulcanisaeta souniana JCM 11219]